MTWDDWLKGYRRRLRRDRTAQLLDEVEQNYGETIKLVQLNLPLVRAVRDHFLGEGEQANFSAGLQVGAMLDRCRSSAAGADNR